MAEGLADALAGGLGALAGGLGEASAHILSVSGNRLRYCRAEVDFTSGLLQCRQNLFKNSPAKMHCEMHCEEILIQKS